MINGELRESNWKFTLKHFMHLVKRHGKQKFSSIISESEIEKHLKFISISTFRLIFIYNEENEICSAQYGI